jgi:hypothetical protein
LFLLLLLLLLERGGGEAGQLESQGRGREDRQNGRHEELHWLVVVVVVLSL